MKKLLIATTALVATAASAQMVAAQNVNISGYGRFGLDYVEDRGERLIGLIASEDDEFEDVDSTQVNGRLRFNIDASMTTDTGITFGGRLRAQYNTNSSNTNLNPGMLFASANGFRMEVGNANTAYDSAALLYASEIGYLDRGFGDQLGQFAAYVSGPYGTGQSNRVGIFGSYSIDGLNIRASYIDFDQTGTAVGSPGLNFGGESVLSGGALLAALSTGLAVNEGLEPGDDGYVTISGVELESELSISADYRFDQFTISGAYANNGNGIDGNNVWFLGGAWTPMAGTTVGLNYYDNGEFYGTDLGYQVTLYGSYKIDATTLKGYVSWIGGYDTDVVLAGNETDFVIDPKNDVAFGIGADYDLGGARLSGDIHYNYNSRVVAGLGVRFNF